MPNRRSSGRGSVQVRLAYDELNLVEFPFALLSDRQRPGVASIIFTDEIRGAEGEPVRRVWTVTGAEEFGLPTATDELVYLILTELTREQGLQEPKVHFSRYDVLRRLGWPDKGSSYRRLRCALDRLLGVTITATRAFYDRRTRSYVDVGFHILDDYALFNEPRGRKARDGQAPSSFIRWNRVIFTSFLAGYVKRLDLGTYLSLRSAVSRRLYRYLDKKGYDGKSQFRIGLTKLALEKLGMSRAYYPSHIRAELARAHEELLGIGFLRAVRYETSAVTGDEMVVYRFGRRREAPVPHEDVVRRLTDLGMAEPVAVQLVLTDVEAVQEQLDYLPFREARNPAALLVRAIQEGWPAPPGYAPQTSEPSRDMALAPRERPRRGAPRDPAEALALLSEEDRLDLERRAADQLRRENPRVAQHPDSAAYGALLHDRLAKLLATERPDLLAENRE